MPRFMRKGRTKVWFFPTVTAVGAISAAADVPAAEELNVELAEVNGFTFSNSPIMVPDMDSAYTSQIGGEDTAAESSMLFYEKTGGDAANPIKVALTKDQAGFAVFFPEGLAGAAIAAGDDYEIWPVVVTSNARTYTTGNEAAQYNVAFSVTSPPSEGTVVA